MSAGGRKRTGTWRRRYRRGRIRPGRFGGGRTAGCGSPHRRGAGVRAACRAMGSGPVAARRRLSRSGGAGLGEGGARPAAVFGQGFVCADISGGERRLVVEPRLLARAGRGGHCRAGALYRASLHQPASRHAATETRRLARRRRQRCPLSRRLRSAHGGYRPLPRHRRARLRPRLRAVDDRRSAAAGVAGRHSRRGECPSGSRRRCQGQDQHPARSWRSAWSPLAARPPASPRVRWWRRATSGASRAMRS